MAGALGEAMNIVYSIVARDETRAGLTSAQTGLRGVKGAAGEAAAATESFASRAKGAALVVGGALVGLAAAYTLLTAGARDANARIAMTAQTMSVNAETLIKAERAIANYHLRMGEASKAGDVFAKTGITNVDTLTKLITTSDHLGEVLRQDADTIAGSLIPAITSLGGEAEDLIGLSDDFATMFRESNVSLDGFSTLAKRMGPDLDAMGFSMEDVMALAMTSNQKWGEGRQVLARYKTAITDTKKEIDDYNKAVADTAQEHDTLVSAIGTAESTLASLADQIAATEQAIADYNADIADASQEVSTLASAYADAQSSTDEFADAYAQVTQQADSLTSSLQSEEEQLASLDEQLARTRDAHADLLDEYAATEQAIGRLEAAYSTAVNANDYFAEGLETANAALTGAEDAYQANADAIDGYRGKLEDLDDGYSSILAEQAKYVRDLEKTRAEYVKTGDTLEDLQAEYATLASSTEIVDEATKKHAAELEKLRDEYARVSHSLGDEQETLAELTAEYDKAASSTEIVDEATKKHADNITGLASEYEQLGDSIDAYLARIDDNAHETGNLQRDLEQEQETLAELTAEYNSLTAAKNSQGSQLFVDPTTMDALATKMQDAGEKVDELTWKIKENGEENGTLAEQLQEARDKQAAVAAAQATAASDTTWYTEAVKAQAEAVSTLGERVQDVAERCAEFSANLQEIATAQATAVSDTTWYTDAVTAQEAALMALGDKVTSTAGRYADLGDQLAGAGDEQAEFGRRLADNRDALRKTQEDLATAATKTGELGLAVADAKGDVDEFGSAAYGAVEKLSPFQEALQKTQDRAAGIQQELGNARDRLGELGVAIADNEGSQAKLGTDMATARQAIADYRTELETTNREIDKFKSAGEDIAEAYAPFADAEAAHAEKVAGAAKAYKDAVDRLGDLKRSRDDEVKKLGEYRAEYDKTISKLNDLNTKIADNVAQGEALRSKQAEMNDVKALFLKNLGLEDTALDTNKQKLEDNTGALQDNYDIAVKRYSLWEKVKGGAENVGFDISKTVDDLGGGNILGALAAVEGLGVLAKGGAWAARGLGLIGGGGAAAPVATGAAQSTLGTFGAGAAEAPAVASGGGITSVLGPFLALMGTTAAATYATHRQQESMKERGGIAGALAPVMPGGALSGYNFMPGIGMPGLLSALMGPQIDQLEAMFSGEKKLEVNPEINAPTGDGAGLLGWLSGARDWVNGLTAASGTETLIPWTGEIDPTVTGGEKVTTSIETETEAGVRDAPDNGLFGWLTNIRGTATGRGDITGKNIAETDLGIANTPDSGLFGWLTNIRGTAQGKEQIAGRNIEETDAGVANTPADNTASPFGWLTSIRGTATGRGDITEKNVAETGAGVTDTPDNGLFGWLTSISGTATGRGDITAKNVAETGAGVAGTPDKGPFGWLTNIVGTATGNQDITTKNEGEIKLGLDNTTDTSTLPHSVKIDAKIDQAWDWVENLENQMLPGLGSLSRWVAERLGLATSGQDPTTGANLVPASSPTVDFSQPVGIYDPATGLIRTGSGTINPQTGATTTTAAPGYHQNVPQPGDNSVPPGGLYGGGPVGSPGNPGDGGTGGTRFDPDYRGGTYAGPDPRTGTGSNAGRAGEPGFKGSQSNPADVTAYQKASSDFWSGRDVSWYASYSPGSGTGTGTGSSGGGAPITSQYSTNPAAPVTQGPDSLGRLEAAARFSTEEEALAAGWAGTVEQPTKEALDAIEAKRKQLMVALEDYQELDMRLSDLDNTIADVEDQIQAERAKANPDIARIRELEVKQQDLAVQREQIYEERQMMDNKIAMIKESYNSALAAVQNAGNASAAQILSAGQTATTLIKEMGLAAWNALSQLQKDFLTTRAAFDIRPTAPTSFTSTTAVTGNYTEQELRLKGLQQQIQAMTAAGDTASAAALTQQYLAGRAEFQMVFGRAPRFHSGGTFQAPPGESEGVAILRSGETVTPPDRAGGDGSGYSGLVDAVAAGVSRALSALGIGSGGGLTVNVNNPVIREELDIRRIADGIAQIMVDDNYRAGIRT